MNNLIVCTRCQHVDMADLAASEALAAGKKPTAYVCTLCLTGHWHDQFAYERYDPTKDKVCNPPVPATPKAPKTP